MPETPPGHALSILPGSKLASKMMKIKKNDTVRLVANNPPTLATISPIKSDTWESFDKRPISAKSSDKVPLVVFSDSVIEDPTSGAAFIF